MFAQVSTGGIVPASMTPEIALQQKLITPTQFKEIKMSLPSGVTWWDYLAAHYPNTAAAIETAGAMVPGGGGATAAYETYAPVVEEAAGAVAGAASSYAKYLLLGALGIGLAYVFLPPLLTAYVKGRAT